MPNWCSNTLIVRGSQEKLEAFIEKNKGTGPWSSEEEQPLSFHSMVPMPAEFALGHTKNPSDTRWYDWATSQWGTKWDACEVSCTCSESSVTYTFETAWSPPIEWLTQVVAHIPDLSFEMRFIEEGVSFAGVAYGENGNTETVEKDLHAAKLEWDGYIDVYCARCDDEFRIEYLPQDECYCPKCTAIRCLNCKKWPDAHEEAKCLFNATTYLAADPNYVEGA